MNTVSQDRQRNQSRVLILTTMNELEGLRSIWDKIPFNLFNRTIAVDANSTDGTREFLADKDCELLTQKLPGRGNAIREAMEAVRGDVVVLMASDGNDDPKYIPDLLSKLDEGFDIVSGSRFAEGGKTDDTDDPIGVRRFGNKLFTLIVNAVWHASYSDATYGMRAFRTSAWRRIDLKPQRNETEFLMSIKAAKLGLKTTQVPMIEGRRVGGEVKARTLTTGWHFLKLIASELRGNSSESVQSIETGLRTAEPR
jgi:glycosyltransferase involved in cell wall biosynthesis